MAYFAVLSASYSIPAQNHEFSFLHSPRRCTRDNLNVAVCISIAIEMHGLTRHAHLRVTLISPVICDALPHDSLQF